MLTPVEICEQLTVDEFIGLCQQVRCKFDVVYIERDDNLDPTVCVQVIPDNSYALIPVKPWPISA